MGIYVAVVLIGAVGLGLAVLRARRKVGGEFRAGDFFRVEVPRTIDKPLATGTRLDAAAALKKIGVPVEECRRLMDGAHDQELVDRYWAEKERAGRPLA